MRLALILIAVFLAAGCMGGEVEVTETGTMNITSTAFADGGKIPMRYSCDGENKNPPLRLGSLPEGTKSLALIVDDPDAPSGDWVHWVVYDIDPAKPEILENSVPGAEGLTSSGKPGWSGPCPPLGEHRYFFRAYALDKRMDLKGRPDKVDLLAAMKGHILAQTQIMGRYQRS